MFLLSDFGFTCGSFDLLHAGHIVMLEECKRHCSRLIVGLQTDPSKDRPQKNKPVQSLIERQIQLKAVKWVDEIVVYNDEKDLDLIFRTYPIDVRFVGEEYKDKDFTGKKYFINPSTNKKIIYTKRDHGFSTSELRERVYSSQQDLIFIKNFYDKDYKTPPSVKLEEPSIPYPYYNPNEGPELIPINLANNDLTSMYQSYIIK
ncbi:hypothetical protein EB118_12315 [bacterium]|nr:hypothetical protein [bacterium]